MAEKFNPFHKWLGLNPKLKNPHHFQLLGVSPSATDEEQIRKTAITNAKKHLAQLEKLPPGKFEELVGKLRKRINDAHKILSNPELREKYLTQLKAKAAQQSGAAQPKQPASPQQAQSTPANPVANAPVDPQQTAPVQQPVAAPTQAAPAPSAPAAVPNPAAQAAVQPTAPVVPDAPTAAAPVQPQVQAPTVLGAPNAAVPAPAVTAQPTAPVVQAQAPVAAQPVVQAAAQPAIPMAVPVSANAPVAPAIAPEAESDGIGEVKINKTRRRKKRSKWAGPIMALVLIGAGGGGGFLLYSNWEGFLSALGISKFVPAAPGVVEEEKPPITSESQALDVPDPNKMKELNMDEVKEDDEGEGDNKEKESQMNELLSDSTNNVSTDASDKPKKKDKKPSNDDSVFNVPETEEMEIDPKDIVKVELDEEQAYRFRRAIDRARRSLFRRDKKVSLEQLAAAQAVLDEVITGPTTELVDEQADMAKILEATRLVTELIEGFWMEVVENTQEIPGSQEIQVGEQMLAFLEADAQKVVLRNSGLNVTYHYYYCPPGLAVALGDIGAIDSIPMWSMQKAAFYAVNKTNINDYNRQIDEFCTIAENANGDCELIRFFADFDFENFLRPSSISMMPSKQELTKLIQPFRDEHDYRNPSQIKIPVAATLSEVLLSMDADEIDLKVAYLDEARQMALRAGDAPRVDDAIKEMSVLADINEAKLMTESLTMLTRSKLEPMQARALMEIAIPFIKSPMGQGVNERARNQLGTRLISIAKGYSMVDCVRRLEQTK